MKKILSFIFISLFVFIIGFSFNKNIEVKANSTPSIVDGYYQIGTKEDLYWFASFVTAGNTSANAKLTNDITVNSGDLSTLTGPSNSYEMWTPIGLEPSGNNDGIDTAHSYLGTFDGCGYTIYGLYYYDMFTYAANAGLFAIIGSGGVVKNVNIGKSWFAASSYIGAIAGAVSDGTIDNCHNVGSYVGAAAYAGGIVGSSKSGTIINSSNSGTVKFYEVNDGINFAFENIGGIAGNISGGKIENCFNFGTVSAGEVASVGGIVGQNVSSGQVINSVNKGNVTGSMNTGGISGYQYGGSAKIANCINVGTITKTSTTSATVADILGNPFGVSTVENSYYTGDPSFGQNSNSGTHISIEKVYSGELAVLMGWGQTLDGVSLPRVDGATIYKYYNESLVLSYSNDENVKCYHNGGTATCMNMAVCDACLEEYGEKDFNNHVGEEYNYELNESDKTKHDKIHSCGEIHSSEEHSLVNGVCEKCEAECGVDFDHVANSNGVCTKCSGFVAPELDSDGYYMITNYGHMFWFAQQVNSGNNTINGKLMNDVSMTSSYKWTPIGVTENNSNVSGGYKGTFDGQKYYIRSFSSFNNDANTTAGLFGTIASGGVVRNVGMLTAYVTLNTNEHYAGLIAGQILEGGLVEKCYIKDCTFNATNSIVGGIAGVNKGTISQCFVYSTTVTGKEGHYGGIVGDYNGGTIKFTYTDHEYLGTTIEEYMGTLTYAEGNVSENRLKSGEITYNLNIPSNTFYQCLSYSSASNNDKYPLFNGNDSNFVIMGTFADYNFYGNDGENYSIHHDLIIEEGTLLSVEERLTLKIYSGITLTNNGRLNVDGTFNILGAVVNNADMVVDGTLTGSGTLSGEGNFSTTILSDSQIGEVEDKVYDGIDITEEVDEIIAFPTKTLLGQVFGISGWHVSKNYEKVLDAYDYEILIFRSSGETITRTFSITPLLIEESAISLEYENHLFIGAELKPLLLVEGYDLVEGRDYDLIYTDNYNVGTANVSIVFKNNYSGEYTKSFTIEQVVVGENASIEIDLSDQYFKDEDIEVEVVVKVGEYELNKNVDYTVNYLDNYEPGTAIVQVRSSDNCVVSGDYYFTILAKPITVTTEDINFDADSVSDCDMSLVSYTVDGLLEGNRIEFEIFENDYTLDIKGIYNDEDVNLKYYYDITYDVVGKVHVFRTKYSYDSNGNHWRDCLKMSCEEVIDFGSHSGGEATCNSGGYCEYCGQMYIDATGIHDRVDGVCKDCGDVSNAVAWIDEDGDGTFNGNESGYDMLSWALNSGKTVRLRQDVDDYVGGVGADNVHTILDLNGYRLYSTSYGQVAAQSGTNFILEIIDSSLAKTGKLDMTISIQAGKTVILNGVSVNNVYNYGGTLNIKDSSLVLLHNAGTVIFSEGYDLGSFEVNYNESGKFYVGEAEVYYDTEQSIFICVGEHDNVEASCKHPKGCTICQVKEGEALPHTEEVVPGYAKTCTEDGLTDGVYCTVCEEMLVKQEVIKAGHTEEVVPGYAATCEEPGLTDGLYCTVCEETLVEQETIDALGHNDNEYGYCANCEISIYGTQLNIGDDLSMKYYIEVIDQNIIEGKKLSMSFVRNEEEFVVKDYVIVGEYYVFVFKDIAPQEIGDDIDAYLYIGDDIVDSLLDYSVEDNCKNILSEANEDDFALITLVHNLLIYGQKAQLYLDYNLENPIADDMELNAYNHSPESYDDVMNNYGFSGNNLEDCNIRSLSVRFGVNNRIYIKMYINIEVYKNIQVVINNTSKYTQNIYTLDDLIDLGDGYYGLYTEAFAAYELEHVLRIELRNEGTMATDIYYNVNNYIYAMYNGATSNEEMKELALALYRYGKAAIWYKSN